MYTVQSGDTAHDLVDSVQTSSSRALAKELYDMKSGESGDTGHIVVVCK